MIGSIRGKILSYRQDRVLVEAGGVGYWVNVTPQTLAELSGLSADGLSSSRNGTAKSKIDTVFFHTEHVVREDAHLLYGFLTEEEQTAFATLISISGIGAQLALAVLATHSPTELQILLLEGDLDSLCLVPGIGPKKGRQLMATLKDRFAIADFEATSDDTTNTTRAEVRTALSELGYSPEEIKAALAELPTDIATGLAQDDLDAAEIVKAALGVLAK